MQKIFYGGLVLCASMPQVTEVLRLLIHPYLGLISLK